MKYCESCRQPSWPKTADVYQRWGKCDVCNTVAFCHEGNIKDRRVYQKKQDWYEGETPSLDRPPFNSFRPLTPEGQRKEALDKITAAGG